MTSALHLATSGERYTPAYISRLCCRAMGGLDLDPASSYKANILVRAKRIYTHRDNGATARWYGKVFVNAPGSCPRGLIVAHTVCKKTVCTCKPGPCERGLIEGFSVCENVSRCSCGLVQQFWRQALTQNTTAVCWLGFQLGQLQSLQTSRGLENFGRMSPLYFPTCVFKNRIRYLDENFRQMNQPPHGSYLTMITRDPRIRWRFARLFGEHGAITTGAFAS